MGIGDKIGNAAEGALGKAKEVAGDLTGDKKLETEGATQNAGADAKQKGEDLKDAVSGGTDDLKARAEGFVDGIKGDDAPR